MKQDPSAAGTVPVTLDSEPSLQHLMEKVAAVIPSKYEMVGLQLGLTLAQLQAIRPQHQSLGDYHRAFAFVVEARHSQHAAIINSVTSLLSRYHLALNQAADHGQKNHYEGPKYITAECFIDEEKTENVRNVRVEIDELPASIPWIVFDKARTVVKLFHTRCCLDRRASYSRITIPLSLTREAWRVDSGVMSLDIHPEHPYLIAVGLYDGTVAVYTLKDKSFNPLYRSTAKTGWHLGGVIEKFILAMGTVLLFQDYIRSLSSERRHSGVVPREGVSGRGETQHQLALVDQDYPKNRMNDGKCDARGRLWCGTMGYEKSPGEPVSSQGTLYCYHGVTHTLTRKVTDVCISNGMAWSPGNTKMYHMDSGPRKLWSFNFDDVSSCLTNRQVPIFKTHIYP
eukprot:Em0002g249a